MLYTTKSGRHLCAISLLTCARTHDNLIGRPHFVTACHESIAGNRIFVARNLAEVLSRQNQSRTQILQGTRMAAVGTFRPKMNREGIAHDWKQLWVPWYRRLVTAILSKGR
jgi:hypothetical protein